jgi:nitroreductase/NAD-dependent dihydropyrimidine dehydrogenase PreA subunit
MGVLIVDESKCKKDGLCVRECATAVIRFRERDGFPEIPEGGICLACGHCVAVCPHDALKHQLVPAEGSPEIREDLAVSEQQAVQLLRSRRSIRLFKDRPVEPEKIRRLIEVARYAPTAGNSQMIEWLVLTDKSQIRRIAAMTIDWVREVVKDPKVAETRPYFPMIVAAWDSGNDSVLRNAPAVVIASAPQEAINGTVDLTLALSYLELMAVVAGLGTCWAGLLQGALLASPSIKAAVGLPANHPHHYPMMLGYPDVKFHRMPERKAPRIVFA